MLHIGLSKGPQIVRETGSCGRCRQKKHQRFFFLSYLQVVDVEGVFEDVGSVSTHGNAGGCCQIATESPHSLHHKHSSLGPRGRLLDLVATLMRESKWQSERRQWQLKAGSAAWVWKWRKSPL